MKWRIANLYHITTINVVKQESKRWTVYRCNTPQVSSLINTAVIYKIILYSFLYVVFSLPRKEDAITLLPTHSLST